MSTPARRWPRGTAPEPGVTDSLNRLVSHLRSNVIAYMALFVALGGTAYAVSLPSNSVGTKQLKNNAVTKKKIKRGAVTTRKVRNATLLGEDFAPGVLLRGDTGPTGPTGAAGATGPTEAFYSVPSDGGDTTGYPSEVSSTTVNLPTAGRLLVFSHVEATIGCATDSVCHSFWALFVDGRLVNRSGDGISTDVENQPESDTAHMIGITDTLTAGSHTISVRRGNNINFFSGISEPNPVIGAVLLGG
jgi:hypothetical protein